LTARPVIDLHCHLLPGFDDGAQNLQTALMMARAAVDQGVGRRNLVSPCYIAAKLATGFS
jgi:tyrosine-protein phosphatase YwqE